MIIKDIIRINDSESIKDICKKALTVLQRFYAKIF
jgi:hypothetical protein